MWVRRFLAVFFITVSVISCKYNRNLTDFQALELNKYYSADLVDQTKLFVKFTQKSETLSGQYFLTDFRSALTEIHSFYILYPNKKTIILQTDKAKIILKRSSLYIDNEGFTIKYKKHGIFRFKHSSIHFQKEPEIKHYFFQNRYVEPVFNEIRQHEIVYGKAKGYYTSKVVTSLQNKDYTWILLDVAKNVISSIIPDEHELNLDLYQPIGDTIKLRPLFIYIHGGAFILGDKRNTTTQEFVNYFVKRGYVVASINYRLGYAFLPGAYQLLERCIYRAVQDSRAALRYLVHFADIYRIDPDNIFIGGNSAGGFISMKTAFMENNETFPSAEGNSLLMQEDLDCLDCSGNDYKNSFHLRGVVNMWGGLTDINLIGKHEKIPLLLIHGDNDNIVPYNYDYPFANVSREVSSFFSKKIYGSLAIYNHAKKLGLPVDLLTISGAGHEPQVDENDVPNAQMDIINQKINDFFIELFSEKPLTVSGPTQLTVDEPMPVYQLIPYEKAMYNWNITGGYIINFTENSSTVRVIWFSNAPDKTLEVVRRDKNGFLKSAKIEIQTIP